MSTPAAPSASQALEQSGALAIEPELAEALTAQGQNGERALNLLRDAAKVLAEPASFSAPYEVAQSCCRNALESLLKIAGTDFFGLEAAKRAVVDLATAAVDAAEEASATEVDLSALAEAVHALKDEKANRGGFRVRQLAHLVQEQTNRTMGGPEEQAARDSWDRFYRETSAVLHGGSAGGRTKSLEIFHGLLAAIRNLFLSLSARAQRLYELAVTEEPTAAQARLEVASMTDPRDGPCFFRTITSERWLDLLEQVQPERLLPGDQEWPASVYLTGLLRTAPAHVVR